MVFAIVGDLSGSGGAERLFTRLHEHMQARDEGVATTFITSRGGLERFRRAGVLGDASGVLTVGVDGRPGQSKLATLRMSCELLWLILVNRFDVVHLTTESPIHLPLAAALRILPGRVRPKLTMTIVDCTLAGSLSKPPAPGTYERQVLDAYQLYERWAAVDGIYAWYDAFVKAARHRRAWIQPVMAAARFCFTEPERFKPASPKQPLVVFAGRLSEQKRPQLFVEAVAVLRRREPELIKGWRFEMYGRGVLADRVANLITQRGLADIVTLTHAIDMQPVFSRSRLFVSTQMIENFTSLAMLEAMSAGNAVIAEDVGQTREFVTHGVNGLLAREPTPEAFATLMSDYLRHPDRFENMAVASRRVATEIHTIDHFADDIAAFWRGVAG